MIPAKWAAEYRYRKEVLAAFKQFMGCIDCGYDVHPAALDFDHIDRSTKVAAVTSLCRSGGQRWAPLWKEMGKCEVRCANCHFIKTLENQEWKPKREKQLCLVPVGSAFCQMSQDHKGGHRRLATRDKTQQIRDRRRVWVDELKTSSGCEDCGYADHPRALQFDHVVAGKVLPVASMLAYSEVKLRTEIAKCAIVCANCHRIRTIRRRGDELDAQ